MTGTPSPQGWQRVKLGDVAIIDWGNTDLTKSAFVDGGKFLGVSAAGFDGRIDHAEHSAFTPVLSAIGAKCGRMFMPEEDFTAIKNTITLTAKKTINNYFLFYTLISTDLPKRGTSQPFISKGDIEEFEILLPTSLTEQQAIADVLSTFDSMIKLTDALRKARQQESRFLRKKLLTSKENWQQVKLGDVADIQKGTPITKKETIPDDIPVIAGGRKPAYYHNQANRTGETITVSASGAYAGFVAYFDKPIFASDCTTIKPKDEWALCKFIFYRLKMMQKDIYGLQKGSVQPHVYPDALEGVKISLPPLKEQQAIADVLSTCDSMIATLTTLRECYRRLRDGLMARLLSGSWRLTQYTPRG